MNAETLLVFLVAAIFLHQKNVYGYNSNRIRNGTQTPAGKFEFLPALSLMIQEKAEDKIWSGICSSTIISKRHLLTAAHCVITHGKHFISHVPAALVDYRPKEKIITNVKNGEMERVQLYLNKYAIATKMYFHQSYSISNQFLTPNTEKPSLHDIAIIEFPEGTDLHITPVKLASNYVDKKGDTAIAAGYGTYEFVWNPVKQDYEGVKPPELLNTTVPVHVGNECPLGFAMPSMICTGDATTSASNGDSGGPLMLQRNGTYYQIGVVSIGNGTVLYVRVSLYCDWISKVTKGEAKCEPLPAIDPNPPPQPAPVNPPAPPPAPGPIQDGTTTQAASNSNATDEASSQAPESNDKTEAPQPAPNPEPQNSNSNVAFTFNVFLLFFLFIDLLVFA